MRGCGWCRGPPPLRGLAGKRATAEETAGDPLSEAESTPVAAAPSPARMERIDHEAPSDLVLEPAADAMQRCLSADAEPLFEVLAKPKKSFPHSSAIYVVRCFSFASAQLIVTGGNDTVLRFIDTEFGQEVRRHVMPSAVLALDIGNVNLVVVGCVNGALMACRYHTSSSTPPPVCWATFPGAVVGVSVLDNRCAVGDETGSVSIFSLQGEQLMVVSELHGTKCVSSVQLGENGFVSSGYDGAVCAVDDQGNRRLVGRHEGEVNGVGFCKSGVVSAGDDGALRLWSAAIPLVMRHPTGVFSIASNPSRPEVVACGTYSGSVVVWDTLACKSLLCANVSEARVNSLSFSVDGKRLFCATNAVYMFDVFKHDRMRLMLFASLRLLPDEILRTLSEYI